MQTCTFFATYTPWLTRELERMDPDLSGTDKPAQMNRQQWDQFKETQTQKHADSTASNSAGGGLTDEARLEKLEKMFETIQKYEINFSRHLQILLDALNHYAATETVVLLGLCARLSTANQGTQYSGLQANEDGGAQA
jgi:gamma-tubulin complex component 2